MNNDDFFTGRTEKHLLNKLKEKGHLRAEEIFGSYTSPTSAQSFMNKIIHFGMAELAAPGIFKLIEKEVKKD